MQRIAWTDAAFTSLSAAVAYDYHHGQAKAMGASDAEAAQIAMEQTENTIGRTAQPSENMDRSRLEMETKGLGKLLFMFQSANRQAFSLVQAAVGDAIFRQGSGAKAGKLIATYFVFVPVVMQTMAGLVRYLFSDDEAEEAWALEDYGKAMMLGPTSGIVLLGAGFQAFLENLSGSQFGSRASNPMVDAVMKSIPAVKDIANGDFDTKDIGDLASAASLLASGFTNANTEAVGVGWSVLKQMLGLVESGESIAEGRK